MESGASPAFDATLQKSLPLMMNAGTINEHINDWAQPSLVSNSKLRVSQAIAQYVSGNELVSAIVFYTVIDSTSM